MSVRIDLVALSVLLRVNPMVSFGDIERPDILSRGFKLALPCFAKFSL